MSGSRLSTLGRLRSNRLVLAGLGYLAFLIIVAAAAPLLATHDPMAVDVSARLQSPSAEHWFGTDEVGRDQFSRVVYGTRIALRAASQSVGLALLLGIPTGLAIGYYGGRIDRFAMRLLDIIGAIPLLLLAIAIIASFGSGLGPAMTAVAVGFAVNIARILRAEVLAEKEQLYVDAAHVIGRRNVTIMFREVLPNAISPVIVQASIYLGIALLIEAMLSFLGLGVQLGEPSWGRMLDTARQHQTQQPSLTIFPGLAIVVTVLMFNVLGEGLREGFDVRSRRSSRPVSGAVEAVVSAEANDVNVADAATPVGGSRVATPAALARRPDPLLAVRNLTVTTASTGESILTDVDLTLEAGEVLSLVGESGSGKSMTALAVLGLLPAGLHIAPASSVRFRGAELVGNQDQLAAIRGPGIGMVFQDPGSALSPAHSVGRQIIDPLMQHKGLSRSQARSSAIDLLARVGVRDASRRIDDYPHQFSGGMAQRVVIAAALAGEPALLIADEPTTALDVTVQEQVLDLLMELREELGMSLLFITHDLGVVADVADHVAVMYAGRIVEVRDVRSMFASPGHPYTQALLATMPRSDDLPDRLPTIAGNVPPADRWQQGCAFVPRCPLADDACETRVELRDGVRCVHAEQVLGSRP